MSDEDLFLTDTDITVMPCKEFFNRKQLRRVRWEEKNALPEDKKVRSKKKKDLPENKKLRSQEKKDPSEDKKVGSEEKNDLPAKKKVRSEEKKAFSEDGIQVRVKRVDFSYI